MTGVRRLQTFPPSLRNGQVRPVPDIRIGIQNRDTCSAPTFHNGHYAAIVGSAALVTPTRFRRLMAANATGRQSMQAASVQWFPLSRPSCHDTHWADRDPYPYPTKGAERPHKGGKTAPHSSQKAAAGRSTTRENAAFFREPPVLQRQPT